MKISIKDLQNNWLTRYDSHIRGIVKGVYPQHKQELLSGNTPKPLWALITEAQGNSARGMSNLNLDCTNQDPQFVYLKYAIEKLPDNNRLKQPLMALLQVEPAELDSPKVEDQEDQHAPFIGQKEELSENAYEGGFEFLRRKRLAAVANQQKWYLKYHLALMQRLKRQAWWGKLAAILYGAALGLASAGYMAILIGFSIITQQIWPLAFLVPVGLIPMQANFWISRRAPAELIFDLFTSPREDQHFSWKKEWTARALGLCNALIWGGLTAYGMWELFALVGATAGLTGAILSGGATFALAMMVFLPELGLGIKFNRLQLEKSPMTRYAEMKAQMKNDPTYINRFWLVLGCVLVGMAFTAMGAGGITASLLGINEILASVILGGFSLTMVPFYLDKAFKNATCAYQESQGNTEVSKTPLLSYAWFIRVGNAFINMIPAIIGAMSAIPGPAGIILSPFIGMAAFVASYLSGEDGKTRGYEEEIDTEVLRTQADLERTNDLYPEPELRFNNKAIKATEHTLLFNPFNSMRETKETEMDLLEARVPMKLKVV